MRTRKRMEAIDRELADPTLYDRQRRPGDEAGQGKIGTGRPPSPCRKSVGWRLSAEYENRGTWRHDDRGVTAGPPGAPAPLASLPAMGPQRQFEGEGREMASHLTTIGFDCRRHLVAERAVLPHHAGPLRGTSRRSCRARPHLAAPARGGEAQPRQIRVSAIKGFTPSMIETAIEITDDRVPAAIIRQIPRGPAREMLAHPVETPAPRSRYAGAADWPPTASCSSPRAICFDQERKLGRPRGSATFFSMPSKSSATRPRQPMSGVFARHGDGADGPMMVGNSAQIPMSCRRIQAGGWGVFVPHELTWVLEHVEPPRDEPRFPRNPASGRTSKASIAAAEEAVEPQAFFCQRRSVPLLPVGDLMAGRLQDLPLLAGGRKLVPLSWPSNMTTPRS